MPTIQVISSKKRCGKDTAASFMTGSVSDGSVIQYSLAEPIKEALSYGFHISDHDFYHDGAGEDPRERELYYANPANSFRMAWYCIECLYSNMAKYRDKIYARIEEIMSKPDSTQDWSIRKLMTTFGTDICVYVNKSIWLQIMMDRVYFPHFDDNITIIISDCRQPHEEKFFRDMNSDFLFITRKGYSDVNIDGHITERGLTPKEGDTVIANDGTLDEFKENVLNYFYRK